MPGTDPCAAEPIADGTTEGIWASDCQSQTSDRGYARYYSFTLEQQSAVTIELESEVDPYLYLRQGDATTGAFLQENDDIASGGVNLNSRISATLAAGAYTIEATTYAADQAGPFTLTISGLGTGGTGGAADACGETIAEDGATTGTWAADCPSSVADRGYARYYTFTLARDSALTIDLESSVDPYLYLRAGEARTGAFLHENDDVDRPGGDYDSQISETLTAGTYTIEATTYKTGETGTFTLTIAGLGDG